MTNTNDLLNAHFEEQRIHDLKIDIDAVLEEVLHIKYPSKQKVDQYRIDRLYEDLKWFKTLL